LLAAASREVGEFKSKLFILDWLPDTDMNRRRQIGLNKDNAPHTLKRAFASNANANSGTQKELARARYSGQLVDVSKARSARG
jgi:TnpA family transposase